MQQVFEWQVAHPWSAQHPPEHRHGPRGWVLGAFLTGVMEAYRGTGDVRYRDHARRVAEQNEWQLGARWKHADDHVIGQTYLELHQEDSASSPIEAVRLTLDRLVDDPAPGRETWWWCDALYMAPPTLAKLAQVTGDRRYLEALDRLFWDSHAALYDPAEQLFYRDHRFFAPADGRKVFWSRGNGWVLAGLARLLAALPANHATRPRYEHLFREMAARLVALQPADGLWRADLLRPTGDHGEASGSAFYCFALAWGLNQGVLKGERYRSAVERAWAALVSCVDDEGRLGWVQPIGFAPEAYDATTWQEYGAGAFLAAGAEVMRLAPRP